MIEKLEDKINYRDVGGGVNAPLIPNEIFDKINEMIEEINRLKENECGCSNCTQWRLINAQSALKEMNR